MAHLWAIVLIALNTIWLGLVLLGLPDIWLMVAPATVLAWWQHGQGAHGGVPSTALLDGGEWADGNGRGPSVTPQ